MVSSRAGAPRFERQSSSEQPPPLIAAAYPDDDPHARFDPNLGRANNRPNNGNRQLPSRPVNRSNTVRGAVRGTIREKGSNIDQAYVPQRNLTRGKTLTRPDRFVAPAPLIDPSNDRRKSGLVTTTMVDGLAKMQRRESKLDFWGYFVYAITFYAPGWALSKCAGITDKQKQRAWKEKVALCSIALIMGAIIAFLTIGLTVVLCPIGTSTTSQFISLGSQPGYIGIQGFNYNVSKAKSTPSVNFAAIAEQLSGQDTSGLFQSPLPSSCNGLNGRFARTNLCIRSATDSPTVPCALQNPTPQYLSSLGLNTTGIPVGYDWSTVASFKDYMVINGNVLNLQSYMLGNPNPDSSDPVDTLIRFVLRTMDARGGKDATKLFYDSSVLAAAVPCIRDRYYAGHLDKITPGCFVSHLFLYVSLSLILAVVFIRFFMAFYFRWFLAHKLIQPPRNLRRKVISPSVLPEGANIDINNTTGSAPWSRSNPVNGAPSGLRQNGVALAGSNYSASSGSGADEKNSNRLSKSINPIGADGMISMASIGAELFVVCLVTCYSEGEEGLRTTLDSISATNYSDARKLMFIVCDGMVTGDGEKSSTPDICVGMIERDERFGEPLAMTYDAVGEGSNAANLAMVYAGHYVNVKGRRTPALVIVKTGLPSEAGAKKPGNRGKRDSQMILMTFFSRVTYNDRMSPLDYDLFRKVQSLMGVTPDFFEVCLMVDADTKVYPDSLGYMIRCMQNDNMIMGLCGETRIANKRQSWVTMIQVFEYFISHHLSKAFESVFGGVNCLPGCFSMYRLKTRKAGDGDWVPVLVQPQVISEYSQSTVVTLHQKNLLLLGEDRFLTTLLLRTFPNRKMVFCPQARCRTVVPDTFSVLLSQRRRWINSTVHNLMELVLVRNLCGTFCFSMQFVIFIDLIGTVVLPVAICLTYYIAISFIVNPPASFADAIPLLLLGAVLGLPAVLIVITTFKLVYVGWMLIYLVALPIWNFVLPVYAFSKFDDFTWGETRKVAGETKGDEIHGRGSGKRTVVPRKKWEDWERQRLKKVKRDAKRQHEFERAFGSQRFLGQEGQDRASSYGSDTTSVFSSEEDQWGQDIGDYLEDGQTSNPPPLGLYVVDDTDAGHDTYQAHEMEAELERGWEEDSFPSQPYYGGGNDQSSKTYLGSTSRPSYPYDSTFSSPPLPPRVFSYSANGRPQHSFAERSTSSLSSTTTHEYNNSNSFYAQPDNGSRSPLVPPPLLSQPNGSQSTFGGVDVEGGDAGEQWPLTQVRRRSLNADNSSLSNPTSPSEMLNNPFDGGRGVSPGGHDAFSRR